MIGWANTSGMGGLNIQGNKPIIHVNSGVGSIIQFKINDIIVKTIPVDKAIANIDGMTADYYYSCTTGIYTVIATKGSYTESKTVEVVANEEYDIQLLSPLLLLKQDLLQTGWAWLSNNIGDTFNSGGRYYTRTTDEPIIVCLGGGPTYFGYSTINIIKSARGSYSQYGNLVRPGYWTTPFDIPYYTFSMEGMMLSSYTINITLNGQNYTIPLNLDNPHIEDSNGVTATDKDKLNQMYEFIERLFLLY